MPVRHMIMPLLVAAHGCSYFQGAETHVPKTALCPQSSPQPSWTNKTVFRVVGSDAIYGVGVSALDVSDGCEQETPLLLVGAAKNKAFSAISHFIETQIVRPDPEYTRSTSERRFTGQEFVAGWHDGKTIFVLARVVADSSVSEKLTPVTVDISEGLPEACLDGNLRKACRDYRDPPERCADPNLRPFSICGEAQEFCSDPKRYSARSNDRCVCGDEDPCFFDYECGPGLDVTDTVRIVRPQSAAVNADQEAETVTQTVRRQQCICRGDYCPCYAERLRCKKGECRLTLGCQPGDYCDNGLCWPTEPRAPWRVVYSAPQSLNDLGGVGDEIWGVGDAGITVRYRSGKWVEYDTPSKADLYSVWVVSSSVAFAAGESGTILRWDGRRWRTSTSAVDVSLYGVWGTSSKDAWVVGENGTLLHYDGKRWNPVNSETKSDLYSVWGSKEQLFVGGSDAILGVRDGRWLEHFGGGAAACSIHGGASLICAVSWHQGSFADLGSTTILQRDKSDSRSRLWYSVKTISGGLDEVHDGCRGGADLWVGGAENVWVAGMHGLAYQFDGRGWRGHETGAKEALAAIWGNDSGEVFALANKTVLRADAPSKPSNPKL